MLLNTCRNFFVLDSFSSALNHYHFCYVLLNEQCIGVYISPLICKNLNDNKCNYRLCQRQLLCLLQFELAQQDDNKPMRRDYFKNIASSTTRFTWVSYYMRKRMMIEEYNIVSIAVNGNQ